MALATKRGKRLLSTKRLRIGVDPGGSQAGAYQELVGAQSIAHEAGARSVEQVDFFGDTAAETGSRTVQPFTVGLGTLLDHMRVYRGLQAANEAGRAVRVRVDVYGYVQEAAQENTAGGTVAIAIPGPGPALSDASALDKAKGGLVTFAMANATAIQQAILNDDIQLGDIIWYGADPDADGTTQAALSGAMLAANAYIINRIEYNDEAPTNIADNLFKVYATKADGGDVAAAVDAATAAILVAGYRREFTADVEQEGSFSGDASGSPTLDGGMTFRPKSIIQPRQLILFDQGRSGW